MHILLLKVKGSGHLFNFFTVQILHFLLYDVQIIEFYQCTKCERK